MAPRSRPPPVHHPTCRHLNQQWRHRLQHLHHQPRLDYFANSKNTLENTLYLHHADHELQQLISQQYFHGALAAWQSPEIFKISSPRLISRSTTSTTLATVPATLCTRYKWGLHKAFAPPTALSTSNKSRGARARAIISYCHSPAGTSRVQASCPPATLAPLSPVLHLHPPDVTLHTTNDDLVGFSRLSAATPSHRRGPQPRHCRARTTPRRRHHP